MKRHDFLKVAGLSACGAVAPPSSAVAEAARSAGPGAQRSTATGPYAAQSGSKPNITSIASDRHRAGLTRRLGYPLDTSPASDRLRERGVAFDCAYCTAPLCVPSRTSMLTGRWPEATHVRSNAIVDDAFAPTHLYKVSRENGYKTGLTGKNHTFLKPQDTDFWRPYELADGWTPPNAPKEYNDFTKWMQGLHANVALQPNPFPAQHAGLQVCSKSSSMGTE